MPIILEHLDLLPGLCAGQHTNLQDNPAKSGKGDNYDCRQDSVNLHFTFMIMGAW